MPEFSSVEQSVSEVVHRALGVPEPNSVNARRIKLADNELLMAERRDLVNHCDMDWNIAEFPWDRPIVPLLSADACRLFSNFWNETH